VFSGPLGELGGDLVVIDFLEARTNEIDRKPILTLAKYFFFPCLCFVGNVRVLDYIYKVARWWE
jgi:hypothetical protein